MLGEWEGPTTTTTESESGIMSSNRTKRSSKIKSTGDVSGKAPGRKAQAARCGFCNLGYEVERTCDTLYVADDVAAHFLCMLYSSGLVQEEGASSHYEDFGMFNPEDVKKEIKRGLHLSCSVCHKKGATIGCDREQCTKTCHYKCGMDHDYVFEENPDEGQFLMYCPKHKDLASDAEEDDENWNSSDEEIRDVEQDTDDENTDPSWDASPSKKATPKRQSQRKRGRPAKKRGKNEGSSPRRSKRARTTVKYQESDEESVSDEESRIPVIRKASPKKEIKKKDQDEEEEEQDAEKEASEPEDQADGDAQDDAEDVPDEEEEEEESGDEKMEKKDDRAQKTDFWDDCRKAGTLGAVCSRVKHAMQSALNNIQDNTASETEYAAVLSFMESTGLMEQIQEEERADSGKKKNGETKEEQPEEPMEGRDVPPKKASRFHSPRKGVKK